MRRLLLAAALVALTGCSTSPCQQLGEKLCLCTGLTTDSCTTQVQTQLNHVAVDDSTCQQILNTCDDHLPANTDFCTWFNFGEGKRYCGSAPPPQP